MTDPDEPKYSALDLWHFGHELLLLVNEISSALAQSQVEEEKRKAREGMLRLELKLSREFDNDAVSHLMAEKFVAEVINAIESIRTTLHRTVIAWDAQSKVKIAPYFLESWPYLTRTLQSNLDTLAMLQPDVHRTVYRKSLARLRAEHRLADNAQEPTIKKTPTARQKKALDFVREKGRVKGYFLAKHLGVKESTFRKHWEPGLRPFGLRNDRTGDGYYIGDES